MGGVDMKQVVTLRLVDGSVHETILETDNVEAKKFIEECIQQNSLIKVKHPRYGEMFGEEYIVGSQVIAFRIANDLEK